MLDDEHPQSAQTIALFPENRCEAVVADGTRWDQVLLILVVYRLLSPGGEWHLHRECYGRSALADLLDMDDVIDDHVLYDCHDLLLKHKTALSDHLGKRPPEAHSFPS